MPLSIHRKKGPTYYIQILVGVFCIYVNEITHMHSNMITVSLLALSFQTTEALLLNKEKSKYVKLVQQKGSTFFFSLFFFAFFFLYITGK